MSDPTPELEDAARAAYEASRTGLVQFPWKNLYLYGRSSGAKEYWYDTTRAALAAVLRDPSPELCAAIEKAVNNPLDAEPETDLATLLRAAGRHILGEEPE